MGRLKLYEKLLWIAVLIPLSSKFVLSIPILDNLFFISSLSLTIFYFSSSIELFKNNSEGAKTFLPSFISGVCFSLILLGFGLKWSFSGKGDAPLIFGNLFLFAFFLPMCFYLYKRRKLLGLSLEYLKTIIFRSIVFGIIGIIVLLTPVNSVIKVQYENNMEYAEILINKVDHR